VSSVVEQRRRNARGDASRERILDAAADVAGERGYEGTSINLVSQRSGLPASSIYWHFKDKDELIAAVIDRSFHDWVQALERPPLIAQGATREAVFHAKFQRTGRALAGFPDFLRLGLMLLLERRPQEATARQKFLEVRRITEDRLHRDYCAIFEGLTSKDLRSLVQLTLALADGYFIAREADDVDLGDAFDVMATAILGAAERFATRAEVPS
jgi:AcrR family transcriptional regulator